MRVLNIMIVYTVLLIMMCASSNIGYVAVGDFSIHIGSVISSILFGVVALRWAKLIVGDMTQ